MANKHILLAVPIVIILLVGCSSQLLNTIDNTSSVASKSITSPLHLSDPKVNQQAKYITVSVLISNSTDKAVLLHPSQFALISDTHVFTPASNSQVPSQIPAHSKVQLDLDFEVINQLSGKVPLKLALQPSSNVKEEFILLGSLVVKKPSVDQASVSSSASSSHSQPTPNAPKETQQTTPPDNGAAPSIPSVIVSASQSAYADLSFRNVPPGYKIHEINILYFKWPGDTKVAYQDDCFFIDGQWQTPDGVTPITVTSTGFGLDFPNGYVGSYAQVVVTFVTSSGQWVTSKSRVFKTDTLENYH